MSRPPKEKNVKKATDEVVPAHSAASKGRRRWSHAASQPEGGRESRKKSPISRMKGKGEERRSSPIPFAPYAPARLSSFIAFTPSPTWRTAPKFSQRPSRRRGSVLARNHYVHWKLLRRPVEGKISFQSASQVKLEGCCKNCFPPTHDEAHWKSKSILQVRLMQIPSAA